MIAAWAKSRIFSESETKLLDPFDQEEIEYF